MNIIEATKDHIFVIQSLAKVVWPVTFRSILSEEQIVYMMDMMYSTSSLEKQMGEQNHHYLILENEGEYVGFLSYETDYKGSNITKVHKIYVLPSAQGKGYGRILLDAARDIASNNNNRELSLNVNRWNKAIDFYQRMGFEIVMEEDIDIGDGFLMQDYVMNNKI